MTGWIYWTWPYWTPTEPAKSLESSPTSFCLREDIVVWDYELRLQETPIFAIHSNSTGEETKLEEPERNESNEVSLHLI